MADRDRADGAEHVDRAVRAWLTALGVAAAVAVLAWLSNLATEAQMLGEDRTLWGVRTFASRVINSGTVWAGLPVLAGWLLRRPAPAAIGGVVVSEFALVVHYALATLTGTMPGTSWLDNWPWFAAAALVGVPLGLVGALGRRGDAWGRVALLVVPAGAILEPFVMGLLDPGFSADLADRWASQAAGVVLLVGGAIGVVLVLHSPSREERSGQSRR